MSLILKDSIHNVISIPFSKFVNVSQCFTVNIKGYSQIYILRWIPLLFKKESERNTTDIPLHFEN